VKASPPTAPMPISYVAAKAGAPPPGGSHAPGGTLASPAAGTVIDAPPNVAFAPPKASFGETLPSKDGGSTKPEVRRAGGLSPVLTTLLVAAALALGFALGWIVGRM
jgi:hypothetical protein